MARDNLIKATVSLEVETTVSHNSPEGAIREYEAQLKERFGAHAVVSDLSISYGDDEGGTAFEFYNRPHRVGTF